MNLALTVTANLGQLPGYLPPIEFPENKHFYFFSNLHYKENSGCPQ